MKEILVITGWYLPLLSANGACLDSILKELYKRGYYSHVVSFAKEHIDYSCEYCKVYPITDDRKPLSSHFLNWLREGVSQALYYPKHRNSVVNLALEQCDTIIKRSNIEAVICVQMPASATYMGIQLKRKYPQKRYILYALDSLTDNIHNFTSWKKIFKYRNARLEQESFYCMDLVMYLACHKDYYQREYYKKYGEKLVAVDVPLIEESIYKKSRALDNQGGGKLVYSGILIKENRKPDYLIGLIKETKERGIRLSMHFYSRGDCEKELEAYANNKLKGILFTHGYVPKDELDNILANSDILVSLGNRMSETVQMLPSKFLYYMSLGKPILHIAQDKYDMCIPYLKLYPKALVLFENGDFNANIEAFVSFVSELDGSLVDWKLIKERFKENTSEYTADIVDTCIKK